MGYSKESLAKKNVFAQKYDEIRRLDGITQKFCYDFFLKILNTYNCHNNLIFLHVIIKVLKIKIPKNIC